MRSEDAASADSGAALDAWIADVSQRVWGERTRRIGALTFADTAGATLLGAVEATREGLELSRVGVERGEATVLDGLGTSARWTDAVFWNALLASLVEFGEVSASGFHAAEHVMPVALALGELQERDGATVVDAFLAGYEVTAGLAGVLSPTFPLHSYGAVGAVGAAVCAALLLDTDPVRAARIAAQHLPLTTWDGSWHGTTVRGTVIAAAATAGLRSAQLAAGGLDGEWCPLFGLLDEPDAEDLQAMIAPAPPRILGSITKMHAACLTMHRAIEAGLLLHEAGCDVDRLEVTVSSNVAMKTGRLPTGRTPLSARFSLPFGVATAVLRGRAGVDDFQPDDDVLALARRIEVREHPGLGLRDYSAVLAVHSHGELIARIESPELRVHGGDPALLRGLLVEKYATTEVWGLVTAMSRLSESPQDVSHLVRSAVTA